MKRGITGYPVVISTIGETCKAFVPKPLPPEPPLEIDGEIQDLLSRANLALGRLDGLTVVLPDPTLFLYSNIRKEAVLSSQIEGTQSSLSDLLLFENEAAPGIPMNDVQEVSNYVAAMEHGLRRMREGMPVSLRLLKEMHGVLLSKGRGSEKEPGEFRRSQNWIVGTRPGNATFVPPPPDKLMECLGEWEKFLHEPGRRMPLLIKAALAHVQFESIHPFLDGNGRIGRLTIALLLCADGALREATLYLSLYLKKHRARYYELLQAVRLTGDWESWLRFFLEGVEETARQAAETAIRLRDVCAADAVRIEKSTGRFAGSALRLHRVLQANPVLSSATASKKSGLSTPTINKAFVELEKLGIAREFTGRPRKRLYSYDACLNILNEGTEPLPRSA